MNVLTCFVFVALAVWLSYRGLHSAIACAWYFRNSVFSSVRNFVLRLLCPVLGGVGLFVVLLETAMDSWAPEPRFLPG